MSRDFIDDDLRGLSRASDVRGDEMSAKAESAITRDGLTKMAGQKSELNHQVADAVHEIEELQQRQGALEREKRELEELGRKQDEYTEGKRSSIEHLTGSVMLLEKEEMQTARMLELFAVIRTRFKESLTELRSISESDWSEEAYQMELNKAIVIVGDAQSTFKKGVAKMEAAGWNRQHASGGATSSPAEVAMKLQAKGFLYWLKVGLAISIPFMAFGTILFLLWMYFSGMFSFG